MSLEGWLIFAAFWVVFVTSPGPNAVNCIQNGMNLGFRRAPSRAPLRKPDRPDYVADAGAGGKTIRVSGAVQNSLRPQLRPTDTMIVAQAVVATAKEEAERLQAGIAAAVAAVETPQETTKSAPATVLASATDEAPATAARPEARPADLVLASTATPEQAKPEEEQEIVTRLSTSGGRHWGINVGRYGSRYEAEKILLRTALSEMATLDGSLRKVVQSPRGFDANFLGMTRETADLACRRLQARNVSCFMIGPS